MPALSDDGQRVTLDLHGCTVDEALDLAERTLRAAQRRGRQRVRLVHGASTSDARARNRTIKHALYDALDHGTLAHDTTSAWRAEGHLLLSLDVTAPSDPRPLRLRDVQR